MKRAVTLDVLLVQADKLTLNVEYVEIMNIKFKFSKDVNFFLMPI